MDRLTEEKIILIVRETRLDDLVRRFNTMEQAKFYVEHLGSDFSDYLREHDVYRLKEHLGTEPRVYYVAGHGQDMNY